MSTTMKHKTHELQQHTRNSAIEFAGRRPTAAERRETYTPSHYRPQPPKQRPRQREPQQPVAIQRPQMTAKLSAMITMTTTTPTTSELPAVRLASPCWRHNRTARTKHRQKIDQRSIHNSRGAIVVSAAIAALVICALLALLPTSRAQNASAQATQSHKSHPPTAPLSSTSLLPLAATLSASPASTASTNTSDTSANKLSSQVGGAGRQLEQVAKAEALTASQPAAQAQTLAQPLQQQQQQQLIASNSKLFEVCKSQTRVGLQLTNLSQIVFQPSDVCSSWHKMIKSMGPAASDIESSSYPWFYIEQLNLAQNNLTVLHDTSGMSRLANLLELRITHNQLVRCEESSLLGLQRLQHLDLSHNKLQALPPKFFQPVRQTIKKLNLSFNSISVLVPNLFDALASLEYLDLSHNDITSHWINDRLFKNLTRLHHLDLSFNKLTVFSSPMTFSSLLELETLYLQHNELRQVPESIQHLRYLSNLDLSQNFIHDITNASYLSNCRVLFNLNLESNLLENITRDAFSDLPALKVLNLANNRISHLDQQAFDFVADLHALRLDSNRLVDFGQAFVNMRFLVMLNISSNRISSFDYAQIPLGLQWLDLHSNKIDKLNNFYYSPSAQQQLSANDINQQSNVGSSIGQQWQSMLRLTTLDVSFNLIKELDNTSLPESLETVLLNNNHIRNIASHTFSSKSNLTRINLSHNQLSTMPFDSLKLHGARENQQQLSVIIPNGHKFVDIHLANNPFVCNCNMGWFSQLILASSTLLQGNNVNSNQGPYLREHHLILSRQLPRIVDAHLINCHLPFGRQSPLAADLHQWSPVAAANQLALHQNHHTHSSHAPLITRQSELLASVHLCPYKSHCFALCFCCDFDACDCEMSCPDNCSCYYDQTWSTNVVDCSANNQINANSQARLAAHSSHHRPSPQPVKFVNIPEKIPMDVTELYLDGLELLHLRANALIGRKNLKTLYVNNSQLYSIESKALATQKSLKILQLNSNYLTELHGHEFEQQVELRELYLAHNQLTSIANMTFAPLKSLQVLHLQNNQLYYMSFWSNLPTGHKLISLNLGSNPWSCQCDHVEPMLQWLRLNVKHLHDRKSVGCQYNSTNSLHLLPPLLSSNEDLPATYGSSNENYPMFDMRMCLNHTVYPVIQSPTSPPLFSQPINPLVDQIIPELSETSSSRPREFQPPTNWDEMGNGTSFIPGVLQPNDEPSRPFNPGYKSTNHPIESGNSPTSHGYQYPPTNARAHVFPSSFLVGIATMALVLVVLILSLVHYRRSMGVWFYSRYGLNMFSATKSQQNIGSLGKHSHIHHHQHPHLHHHQCGASSTGSTSSSTAASSNLSQALCHQQSNTTSSGLVTTPLIVSSNHQVLNASSTTSPYNDDERLFDAYLTYSKLDEQFINDFIAPELEYGRPPYRVALHYRDLPVHTNEILTECITETAKSSRRIIMVLSEQLLKTEWKEDQFRSALLEAVGNNYRQRLIVIMLGELSVANMNADLILWMKSCTCISWGDKMFWQRLRFAMPELAASRQQPQNLRYQTLSHFQQGNTGKPRSNLGANLLKSTGLFGGSNSNNSHNHQAPTFPSHTQQLVTTNSIHQAIGRPLPQPNIPMLHQQHHPQLQQQQPEEHHYAHLTPTTMIYNQQHTYHQPNYGDLQHHQQQQQQQQHHQQCAGRDNPTVPVHI